MMKFPEKINILKYKLDNRTFFYDLDSGILVETSQVMESILDLIPKHNEDEIIDLLKKEHKYEEIIQNIDMLKQTIEKRKLFNPIVDIFNNRECDGVSHLWLNVSHDCNLRCVYCYAEGGNYGGKASIMNEEIAKKSIDYWYKNLDDKSTSYIFFFGGEPLINKDLIYYGISYINELLKPLNRKPKYCITTNGTIYDEDFTNFLVENKVNLLFSIDGDEAIQNENRPFSGGKGSYSNVIRNVEKYKKKFGKIKANIVVTKKTLSNLSESVEHLWNLGFNDVSFSLAITEDLTLSMAEENLVELKKQIETIIEKMIENIENQKHRFFDNIIKFARCIHNGFIGEECSFTSNNVMMFIPNGDIHKCHRLIDEKEFSLGSVLEDKEWKDINKNYCKSVSDKLCRECWALRLCGGGCPQEGYVYYKDINKPYNLTCELNKFLIFKSFEFYLKIYTKDDELANQLFKSQKNM